MTNLFTNLPLQHAQGQWAINQNDNEWVIVDSTGIEISRLPSCLKDFEAMRVIHFGREFEKLAYVQGMEVGEHKHRLAASNAIQELQQENHKLKTEIENLKLRMTLSESKGV